MTRFPWPVVLRRDDVVLRPLRGRDVRVWEEVRSRNAQWLGPWDATVPPQEEGRRATFRSMARQCERRSRAGEMMAFALEVEGRFAGQVNVNNIVWGSARFGSIGYWIDRRCAGRGLVPLAVAMVVDHSIAVAGLHRLEIAIRPENSNSLRVVEKLGLHEVGLAPRYLHIDGDWRDHRLFAITAEEWPEGGLVGRLTRAANGRTGDRGLT